MHIKYLFFKVVYGCFLLVISCSGKDIEKRTVDPFKVYMPDFNLAIEQNDHYRAWNIQGGLTSRIFRKKIYKSSLKDSLYYVFSGLQPFSGANIGFCAQNLIFLPHQSRQIRICLQYEYSRYPDAENELFFEIIFRKSTVVLQKDSIALPFTYRIDKEEEIPQQINSKEFNLDIPAQTDNAVLYIKDKGSALSIVALGRCDIAIDGKALSTYTYDHSLPFTQREIQSIQSQISDSLMISADTRLIGIGKSILGCKEFEHQQMNIIKNWIINKKVRFLGYEIGFLQGYYINEYIHGRMNDIEEILKHGETSFYNQINVDLFHFMRSYNEENDYPLTVIGFDIDFQLQQPERIWNRLETLFPDNPQINQCLERFFDIVTIENSLSQNQVDGLQKILKEVNSNYMGSLYERYFQFLLSEYINHFDYIEIDRIMSFKQRRQQVMAENITVFFNMLPEDLKLIIVGHLDVLSKKQLTKDEQNTSSTGYYLNEVFKNQYQLIGLYAGYGSFFANRNAGYEDEVMLSENERGVFYFSQNPVDNNETDKRTYLVSYPVGKSIEQLCLELSKPVFYLNHIQNMLLLDKVSCSRTIGDQYFLMQFEPSNIRSEVDIIWFTEKCHSIFN
jgi:hypothetical protein